MGFYCIAKVCLTVNWCPCWDVSFNWEKAFYLGTTVYSEGFTWTWLAVECVIFIASKPIYIWPAWQAFVSRLKLPFPSLSKRLPRRLIYICYRLWSFINVVPYSFPFSQRTPQFKRQGDGRYQEQGRYGKLIRIQRLNKTRMASYV